MAAPHNDPPHGALRRRVLELGGWRLFVAMLAIGVLGFAWADVLDVVGPRPSTELAEVLNALAYGGLALWGGTLMLRAARTMSGREQVAWIVLPCGVIAWSIAAILGVWPNAMGSGPLAGETLGTAVFAANVLLVFAVAMLPPSTRRTRRTRWVDTAIMIGAAICLMWSLRIDRVLDGAPAGDALGASVDAGAAYTVLNFVAIVVAIAALTRCRPDRRGEILPVAAALVVASVGDVIAQGSSGPGDLLGARVAVSMHLVALALFVIAGARLNAPSARDGDRTETGPLALPELATLLALVALAVRERLDPDSTATTVVLGTILVLLAILRLGQLEREQRMLTRTLEESASRLRVEARTDMLTGLGNRLALDERLQLAVERQHRSSTPADLSVFFIDLDHFKRVNDGLGHQVGDELLVEVAHRLRTVMGEDVFRVGGDEFVAFREHADANTPAAMADTVLRDLGEPVVVRGHELNAPVSIGLATRSVDRSEPDPTKIEEGAAELLRHADLALYRAKQLGRGRAARYDPDLQRRADQRLALQQGLRRGLAVGEMEVHYRPVMDLTDGTVAGAQAFLRWVSPEYGTLTPRSFFEAASAAALLPLLDELVLGDLTAAMRTSRAISSGRPGQPMWIATRLTLAELTHPALPELVARALADSGCDPSLLRLEVSEDTIVDAAALEVLTGLRKLGIHLTVAAFGTGPSSLIRLDRYPASTIKLDRSFVEGLGRRRDDTLVVSTVAELAGELGLELAADGVSEAFQVEMLRDLGCRYAQGRYFGSTSSRTDFFAGSNLARTGATR